MRFLYAPGVVESMSATEVTFRGSGGDASPLRAYSDGESSLVGSSESGRSGRSTRDRDEPDVVVQSAPEPEQQPALLGLVDRFVELLNALWDRLTSL